MVNMIQYQYSVGTRLFRIDNLGSIVRASKINEIVFDGKHLCYRLASGDYIDEKSINYNGYMFSSLELAFTYIVNTYEFDKGLWQIKDFVQHDKKFVTWLLKQDATIKSLCKKSKSFADWYEKRL